MAAAGFLVAAAPPAPSPTPASPAPPPAIHPDRTLTCDMRRVTNADLSRVQPAEELLYEGNSRLVLHLGAVAVHSGPPPETFETPEATAPTTRVTADDGGILAGVPQKFTRVVDRWPDRVEIATEIDDQVINVMVLNPIDVAANRARLFMTFSNYQFGYDPKRIYIGECTVAIGAAAQH
ncbi:hypothetical protein IP88_03345 [alpha proteobacterium AAP81b]|nr:hypothetical protein IP88_03345 [alpha proteobacterium AAP81b]